MEKNNQNSGIFYVLGTPIGNLEDITLRAIRILKEADLILCEDTRVTRKLLDKYEIKNNLLAYPSDDFAKNKDSVFIKKIINDLRDDKKIVLVSDAGTPGISDPGNLLVRVLREEGDLKIENIPGASALVSAISISGFPASNFTFLGFVPNKKGRQTFFKKLCDYQIPVFFYESRHRIIKTLQALKDYLPNTAKVFVGRELTKIYDESLVNTPTETFNYFVNAPEKQKGEFVIGIFLG